jgi:glycosyltransferase involved in cell wall biosynthesis
MALLILQAQIFHQADPVALQSLIERLGEHAIRCTLYAAMDPVPVNQADTPQVMVSIGGECADYPSLCALPLEARRRWLHFAAPAEVTAEGLTFCWLAATEPAVTASPPLPVRLPDRPLVSVFTAAYRTGERLFRPYRSLLAQTYPHWEWVIVDDSGDAGETQRNWIAPLTDSRIRKIPPAAHSGHIGTVKHRAAQHCAGEILVELDHDDQLTPDALERLVAAFQRHPDCGFAFAEAAEINEGTLDSHWYGWDAGYGFLVYWRQLDRITERVVDVPRTPSMNAITVRHLVGLPNHPRAWRRTTYHAAGGHRPQLNVADDYDLLMRTLLITRPVRVPDLLYLQYRNAGGDNQTFARNRQIQFLCAQLQRIYRPRMETRLAECGLPLLDASVYRRIWTCDEEDARWQSLEITDREAPDRLSLLCLCPAGHSAESQTRLRSILREARERCWQAIEVIAVGDIPEQVLEDAALEAPPGRVRWWRTEPDWSIADMRRYGRLLCTGTPLEDPMPSPS